MTSKIIPCAKVLWYFIPMVCCRMAFHLFSRWTEICDVGMCMGTGKTPVWLEQRVL